MKKLLLFALFVVGCSSTQPSVWVERSNLDIEIFDEGDPFPENYCIKDEIFIGRQGVDVMINMDCGYLSTLNLATDEAKKMGGEAIKITKMKRPSVNYQCYRMYALVLTECK